VPDSAEQSAARKALARRESVTVLRLAESVAGYAAAQLGDGLGPAEARQAALDAAAELADVAGTLRRLARLDLDRAQRRALAVELAASGMSRRQIGRLIGVAESTVRRDLAARR
jgi:hypothetical protein